MGTPALTTRGLTENDMDQVVDFIDRGLQLSKEIFAISGPKIVDFKKTLHENKAMNDKVKAIRKEVEEFCSKFPLPGFDDY